MTVTRIVANFATADVKGMAAFYSDLLNLNILMDQGWIITLGSAELGPVQLSIASQGGAGVDAVGVEAPVRNQVQRDDARPGHQLAPGIGAIPGRQRAPAQNGAPTSHDPGAQLDQADAVALQGQRPARRHQVCFRRIKSDG